MNISQVKTAVKVGSLKLRTDGHRNYINFDYKLANDLISSNIGRVYLFTSNDKIIKIGGSKSEGGIKTTLAFYLTSMTGSPGVPRFVIHLLIRDLLREGKNVECYMITSPKALANVSGLFNQIEVEIASFTEMENRCKRDYYESQGRYPEWNFQENNTPYPPNYAKMHNEYHQRRLGREN